MTQRRPYERTGWQADEERRWGRRVLSRPEPGWFAIRKTKGGVFVPACIVHEPTHDPDTGAPLDRSWLWHGIIDGEPDPDPLPVPTERVRRIWTYGRRIEEAEYRFLVADREWAAKHAPDSPEANPDKPIDLGSQPPLF